jgi:hypothetical protein
MLQAFIVTLREGLEAFLIVAISVAFLRKSGRHQLVLAVRWGIAASIALSAGAASCSAARRTRRCGKGCSPSPPRCSWRRSSSTCGGTPRHQTRHRAPSRGVGRAVGFKAALGVFLFRC